MQLGNLGKKLAGGLTSSLAGGLADKRAAKTEGPEATNKPDPTNQDTKDSADLVFLSNRLDRLEAISQDFQVRDLPTQDMNALQDRLFKEGFISATELTSLNGLALARQNTPAEPLASGAKDHIDALAMVDNYAEQLHRFGGPRQLTQGIDKVLRLLKNLDAAQQQQGLRAPH